MNTQIIKTVTEPEDLYIIGSLPELYYNHFGQTMDASNKEAFDILNQNCVYITDDYQNVDIRGIRSNKSNFCIETEGSVYILTKSEMDKVISILGHVPLNLIDFHELINDSYDHYTGIIRDYKGEVRIGLYNDFGIDILDSYDDQEGVLHSPTIYDYSETNDLCSPTILVESGFTFKYVLPPAVLGYKEDKTVINENVYKDSTCNCYAYKLEDDKIEINTSIYEYIGTRKTTQSVWLRQ